MVLACETARGSIDYAEGVEGLVQAFHRRGTRRAAPVSKSTPLL